MNGFRITTAAMASFAFFVVTALAGSDTVRESAREGAKVLVVEYLHMLGGVGTAGLISTYHWGNREGFTATVPGGARWEPEQKAEWWRETLRDAGAEVWFGTMGCGAVVRDDRVTGAVVATPEGRGVVLAGVVIDSTGNSDIAAAAGAETDYTDAGEFGMQATGLPSRRLGDPSAAPALAALLAKPGMPERSWTKP